MGAKKMVDLPGLAPGCSVTFLPVSTSLALLIKCTSIVLIYKLFGSVPAILLPLNSQSRWMTVIIYSENLYYNRSLIKQRVRSFRLYWMNPLQMRLRSWGFEWCRLFLYWFIKDSIILLASSTSATEANLVQAHKVCQITISNIIYLQWIAT